MNASQEMVSAFVTLLGVEAAPIAINLLSRFGRPMTPKVTPATGRMRPNYCYHNSMDLLAFSMQGGNYCEGLAVPEGLMPLEHGWVLDTDGLVIDPTWSCGSDYFGCVFTTEFMFDYLRRTESLGVFGTLAELGMTVGDTLAYLEKGIVK